MLCAICAEIPDSLLARTGHDEHLPKSTWALTKPKSGDASKALWECPDCHALYVWTEYVAQTGSGNNDEDTLDRIPADRMATIRKCLERGAVPAEEFALQLGDVLFAFPIIERDLVLSHIRARDPELARAFIPRMVRLLHRTSDRSLMGTLRDWASDPDDARTFIAQVEEVPPFDAEEEFAIVIYACQKTLGING